MAGDLRVVVSRDGTLACLVEPNQVAIFALPDLTREAEVGIDENAEVAVVGEPANVVVVAPGGVLHVVDPRGPDGPEKVAELAVDEKSRIVAVSGGHVLIASPQGAAFVEVGKRSVLARLPGRIAIGAVGTSALPDHFLIVIGGVLEEWSARTRSPQRRFRLDTPVAARHVGAGGRHVWYVAEASPDKVVVLQRAGGARPAQIDLAEPALRIAADPAGGQLAIVGAQTRALYIVGLGERGIAKLHPGPIDDVAWRGAGALVCAKGGALELVEIARGNGADAREAEPVVEPEAVREAEVVMSAAERLSAWKRKMTAHDDAAAETEPAIREWRDAIAQWTRRQIGHAKGDPPLIAAGPLHDVALRLGIAEADQLALWLVYGARLCGLGGIPPVDLAEVCTRRWEDALGTSELATTHAFVWRRDRVHLAREVVAALDERPPLWGTIATGALAVVHSTAVVAPPHVELTALAGWAAPSIGSLLVPNERGLARPARFLFEARVRGLAPLVPWARMPELPPDPSVIVIEDRGIAAELGLPLALTWGETA